MHNKFNKTIISDRQLKPEYLNNAGVANSRRAGVAISENGVVYQVLRSFKTKDENCICCQKTLPLDGAKYENTNAATPPPSRPHWICIRYGCPYVSELKFILAYATYCLPKHLCQLYSLEKIDICIGKASPLIGKKPRDCFLRNFSSF